MERIKYETIDEEVLYERLENGLEVFLVPKVDYYKTYGLFATRFGSNSQYIKQGHNVIEMPAGIAHFLEHQMFDKEGYSVDELFTRQSASCNAYTSFTKTAYLFSATDYINENIVTLLDFVQKIEIDDDSVEKERGIILSEYQMYQDDPYFVLFFENIRQMYQSHPITIDILGSEESIKKISRADLEQCYYHYYHPSNMTLVIVGNVSEETMRLIKMNQDSKQYMSQIKPETRLNQEPIEVVSHFNRKIMDVSIPKYALGIKLDMAQIMPHDELYFQLLLNTLFSKSGVIYKDMLEKQLINKTFRFDVSIEQDYGFIQLTCDTIHPDKLDAYLKNVLLNLNESSFDQVIFSNQKRKLVSDYITLFNSPESIANTLISFHFEDQNLFEMPQVIEMFGLDQVGHFKSLLHLESMSTLVIEGEKGDRN